MSIRPGPFLSFFQTLPATMRHCNIPTLRSVVVLSVSAIVLITFVRAENLCLCCKTQLITLETFSDLTFHNRPPPGLFIHLCSVNVTLFLATVGRGCVEVQRSVASPPVTLTVLTCDCCCFFILFLMAPANKIMALSVWPAIHRTLGCLCGERKCIKEM